MLQFISYQNKTNFADSKFNLFIKYKRALCVPRSRSVSLGKLITTSVEADEDTFKLL